MKEVTLRSAVWYGDREMTITFPDEWEVKVLAFEDRPKLSEDEMRAAFRSPVGTPSISELAKTREKAVLIADDLTRPTPASEVIPFILEELKRGGIDEDATLIMMGVGCHRQMRRDDLVKKLGEEAV